MNLFAYTLVAQVASDTIGCVPFLVKFTSPDQTLSSPIWDFKDGASADKLNPSHVFIQPGTYVINLRNNGELISEATITVLPEIIPQVEVDTNQGCAPLSIKFFDKSIVPFGVTVTDYFWVFGDGDGSNLQNPEHTYFGVDKFDVTLNLTTTIPQCNITKEFEDLIDIKQQQNVGFVFDSIVPECKFPLKLYITYTGVVDPTHTYSWDFGNGQTYDDFQPPAIEFQAEGLYNVQLVVDNNAGCRSKISRVANLGFSPEINISIPDTVCLNVPFVIGNFSGGNSYFWSFGDNANLSISEEIAPKDVWFTSVGAQSVTLTVSSPAGCSKDTSFQIFVTDINADFTIDPSLFCSLPQDVIFTAEDDTHLSYFWNGSIGSTSYTQTIENVERDSFYYNLPVTMMMTLDVLSKFMCSADSTKSFSYQLPNSQFELNKFQGVAPFLLKVTDKSISDFPIVKWIYDWGDGTSSEYDASNIQFAEHIYDTPGEYYVNLTIITENGCIDEYYGAWITVHEPTDFEIGGIPSGGFSSEGGVVGNSVCINEELTLSAINIPQQIDGIHFSFGNSSSNCETKNSFAFTVKEAPGELSYAITLYNGNEFYEIVAPEPLTIKGAKAVIDYQVSCDDKLNVFFSSQSVNATKVTWVIQGDSISQDTFHYLFPSTGDYDIQLIAVNEDDGCAPDIDSVKVMLRDPKAVIVPTDNWCAGVTRKLISTPSTDEVVGCHLGYVWLFPKEIEKSNIVTDKDTVETELPIGFHQILLEVRDVNGCRDTAALNITVHGNQADFIVDREQLCTPVKAQFTDASEHDAELINYQWSFEPTVNTDNISFVFDSLPTDSIAVSLTITDIFGCKSTVEKYIGTYQPVSKLTFDSIVCQPNIGLISASDFTDKGSFLHFEWSLDSVIVSNTANLTYADLEAGIHYVHLTITEDATLCTNNYDARIRIINPPQPVITGLEDSIYCYPKSLQLFGDSSIIDPKDRVVYRWNFGNNRNSTKINPVETFKKGQFLVTFNIKSVFRCENTVEKWITLVGPEGRLEADKVSVCKGENITFTLYDEVDVSSFFWDFGQGEISNDVTPITYQYDFVPASGTTFASLVLESAETGCETILTTPVEIHRVDASFQGDTTCETSIKLVNLSQGNDVNSWTQNGNIISNEAEPEISFGAPGNYTLSLAIANTAFGCKDTIKQDILFLQKPSFTALPFVNLCDNETYSIIINPEDTYEINPPGLATINGQNLVISTNQSTTLAIKAIADNGCFAEQTVSVSHSNINVSDSLYIVSSCGNAGDITLNLGSNPDDNIIWTLDGSDIGPGVLSCLDCPNPIVSDGVYGTLQAVIFNENTCKKNTWTFNVEEVSIEVPNIFSPNNDMVNDVFRPVATKPSQGELILEDLRLINRWGKQVYASDQPWDGIIDGQAAAAEVYYFQMTFSVGKYCRQTVKGDVTLVR